MTDVLIGENLDKLLESLHQSNTFVAFNEALEGNTDLDSDQVRLDNDEVLAHSHYYVAHVGMICIYQMLIRLLILPYNHLTVYIKHLEWSNCTLNGLNISGHE